jgi:hypothetical protein
VVSSLCWRGKFAIAFSHMTWVVAQCEQKVFYATFKLHISHQSHQHKTAARSISNLQIFTFNNGFCCRQKPRANHKNKRDALLSKPAEWKPSWL